MLTPVFTCEASKSIILCAIEFGLDITIYWVYYQHIFYGTAQTDTEKFKSFVYVAEAGT